MTDKFYADRPDKGAHKVLIVKQSYCNQICDFEFYQSYTGEYFNPFLKVRYTPRKWWKFWAPKFTVTFEGDSN